jgi:hypothetical protein
MKEIDFIPDWYKRNIKYKIIYQSQYLALGVIVFIIIIWNFLAVESVSNATARIDQIVPKYAEAEKNTREFINLQKQLEQLREKTLLLEEVDSRINVPSVLAEISFLINERTVLDEVTFVAEEFTLNQQTSGGSTVRPVESSLPGGANPVIGNVRFKVTISGMTTDASDVAELICKLEDSPYFCQVIPLYSRNTKRRASDKITRNLRFARSDTAGDYHLSEFEISCYLDNYRQQKLSSITENQPENCQR